MDNVQLTEDWIGSLVRKLPFLWGMEERTVISEGIRNAGFFILLCVLPLILIFVCVLSGSC